MKVYSEAAFETVIEKYLLDHNYKIIANVTYNKENAFFPQTTVGFIKETQEKEWAKLETLLGANTESQIVSDLTKWLNLNGSLITLRHGFKCYGRTLQVAYFKAAHTLNPELEKKYASNILGITRQLNYSFRTNFEDKRRGIID